MRTTLAQRIKLLRIHYRLSTKHFAQGCLVSDITIFNLEKGSKMSDKTLTKICDAYGTTREWLLEGKGSMLPHGATDILPEGMENKDRTYIQLVQKSMLMEREIERLWSALNHLVQISGKNLTGAPQNE
jgi:transcriptional regulator with XRE-family HTH domain